MPFLNTECQSSEKNIFHFFFDLFFNLKFLLLTLSI